MAQLALLVLSAVMASHMYSLSLCSLSLCGKHVRFVLILSSKRVCHSHRCKRARS